MITNITKKTVLAKQHKICKSLLSRARGLMFSKPKVLVFCFDRLQRTDLHMFFVFFPIDVAFLDQDCRVVDMKLGFKPFTWYTPKADSQYVIETPAGILKNTSLGDKILIED